MSNMEMEGGIKTYLRDIAKTPLLTREEEFELAERIKNGDKAAREHMIRANLRLVVKIAQDYANYGLPLLDLISEGNLGLMKSVERFDPNKGGKLSTYAAWWIKQSIKRALANQGKTIRLPVHMVDKISKMRRVAMVMSEELGREPTDEELAEEIGIDRAKIAHLKSAAVRPMSLDAPVSDDDTTEFGEIIGDEKAQSPLEILSRKNMHMQLDDLLEVLDERERKIIDARFGLTGQKPKTLEEVGKEFGVTRERIRQLENIALKKARKKLKKREEEQPEAYAGPDFLGHQDEVFQPRSIIAPSKKRQIAPVKRGGPVRVRQPLGGRNRDKFVETPSVKRDIQRELLEVKRRNMPSLEERESLESTQQQVIDLWFGFDGTRFVVESGLNFREIGERLRITADEARTFYEDAMVFLERNRAHLSLPRTVDEYEHAVEDAGCAEVLEREIDTHRVLSDEGSRESSHDRPTPWWKTGNLNKIEPPKHSSVIQVGSPRIPASSPTGNGSKNGDRGAAVLSGATPPAPRNLPPKTPKPAKEKNEAPSDDREKEAVKVRTIFDSLGNTALRVAQMYWGENPGDMVYSVAAISAELNRVQTNIHYHIKKIREKIAQKFTGLGDNSIESPGLFIEDDTSSRPKLPEMEEVRRESHVHTKTFSDAQDSLIVSLYNPDKLEKLAEDLDISLEHLRWRIIALQLESFYAHIEDLESGKGDWITNRDFAHRYGIDIGWLESGKKASHLLHNEATSKDIAGPDYYDMHVRECKYYSPHTQALLLRAYKSKYPSRDCSPK